MAVKNRFGESGVPIYTFASTLSKSGAISWSYKVVWDSKFSGYNRLWQICHAPNHYAIALTDDGTIYTQGKFEKMATMIDEVPILVNKSPSFKEISTSSYHQFIPAPTFIPIKLPLRMAVASVACGFEHAIALSSLRTLYTWGKNSHGQLGHGDFEPRKTPTEVQCNNLSIGIDKIADRSHIKIIIGPYTSGVQYTSNIIYTWGHLSAMSNNDALYPKANAYILQIPDRHGHVHQIQFGLEHAVVLTKSGTVFTWSSKSAICRITMPESPVIHIACGWSHNLAMVKSGHIYAWGTNIYGECGVGTFASQIPLPQRVVGLPNYTMRHGLNNEAKLVAFGFSSMLQRDHGTTVYAWGIIGPSLCTNCAQSIPSLYKSVDLTASCADEPTALGISRIIPRKTSVYTFGPILCKGQHKQSQVKLHQPRGSIVIQPIYEYKAQTPKVIAKKISASNHPLLLSQLEINSNGEYVSHFYSQHNGHWEISLSAEKKIEVLLIGQPLEIKIHLMTKFTDVQLYYPEQILLTHVGVEKKVLTWHSVEPLQPHRIFINDAIVLKIIFVTQNEQKEWTVDFAGIKPCFQDIQFDTTSSVLLVRLRFNIEGATKLTVKPLHRALRRHSNQNLAIRLHCVHHPNFVNTRLQSHRLSMESFFSATSASMESFVNWLEHHKDLANYVQHSKFLEILKSSAINYGYDAYNETKVQFQLSEYE
ncbi:hypothetical protein THRCLA_02656 [Thraustotheca clavata]|uniref:Regulator of chromosome condensation (RCC1) n=1 Tax=Thraustotheca clavata TaxID=74557 RepID=A0A1W0A4R8_9STRA|nr:hypothetical protein THRCLA_02656 [Thraustotheca clavata]